MTDSTLISVAVLRPISSMGPHVRAKIHHKSQTANDLLTATVQALQEAAWPHEQADKRAARELMIRAWGLLGDEAFIETCKAHVKFLEPRNTQPSEIAQ